ncbi:MAG: AAA family ATPase, partial [Planctomycetota bacterium]
MTTDVKQIANLVQQKSEFVRALFSEMDKVIVGQRYMLERLLIGLLANGHILLEGVPGLAKTMAVTVLSRTIHAQFRRIQFTPDLLPADLIGTQIYRQSDGQFYTRKGPIFANIILADEINRAPAKVQSALLEAMQERQVSIGEESFPVPSPFMVLATQNPIEQEGTYPLPEAQLDRFMLKLKIDYPNKSEERKILDRMAVTDKKFDIKPVIRPADITEARAVVDEIYIDDKIKDYIVDVVCATRDPQKYG